MTNHAVTHAEVENLMFSLTNQPPAAEQVEDMEALRAFAKNLGRAILIHVPPSRERSLAITHLEDSVMWAIKGIALRGGG